MVDVNAPLLNRLMKEKKGDVVHSSAYAKAQNQGGIGSSSMQSFEQRKVIDQNRSMIRKYGDSKIAMEAGKTSWQARRDATQSRVVLCPGLERVVVDGYVDRLVPLRRSRVPLRPPTAGRRRAVTLPVGQ